MTKLTSTPPTLECTPAWARELLGIDISDFEVTADSLHKKWGSDTLTENLRMIASGTAQSRFSFLFAAKNGVHLLSHVLDRFDSKLRTELLADFALSDSLYIPYDLRAASCAALGSAPRQEDVLDRINAACEQPPRRYKDLSLSPSNDIDHNFHIPADRGERDRLMVVAADTAMRRARARLARRALGKTELDPADYDDLAPERLYVPHNAATSFSASVTAPGLDWRDFLIDWNEILVETPEENYTIAEILRLLLLDPEYHLPGHNQRARADAVNLNLLKTFSGATIGLKAGALFVEHGFRPEASFFLLGENAILGKSCIVDATGVVLIEPKAFLGGGFSPILIHTHKHMRGGGADERKSVAPTGFLARSGARLPMDFVGLLEVMDMPSGRWPGLERMDIDILNRDEVWPSS
ncbi:MAG: hypothetical protein JAZ02_06330 [Candidatus Thiodiazotropha endolucinida]|nr:hypothetical protein [Candidatus Thiodiazotropha endolucinida]